MPDVNALMALLQDHIHWHRARLFTLCALVLALLRVRTVNLTALARSFNARRSPETNYRRLQRFFALFDLGFQELAQLLLALRASTGALVLVMDRTQWHYGAGTTNLLVVGYLESGIVIPLVWTELGKPGATSEDERIALMQRVLPLVAGREVEAFVADREFVGEQFFRWLCKHEIRFVVRIRKNARLRHERRQTNQRADAVFASLVEGAMRRLRDRHLVHGTWVYVVAARQGKEPWILVTTARPGEALRLYGQRWAIETMFGAFKSRGFNVEATHLVAGDRLEKLFGVLALGLAWALRVGLWRTKEVAVALKTHGRRAKALFRVGLDYLQEHLLAHNWAALRPALQLLSCT